MKFEMAKNSLFAVLLRSPWWISAAVAAVLFAGLRLVLPEFYALCGTLPFIGIAGYAGWLQLRAPSAARVAEGLGALRAMSWDEFSAVLEEGFRRDGYRVNRLKGGGADFEMSKAGRVTLAVCRRWKVARTGIEPLRELDAARRAGDAHECIYVAAGEFTDNSRAFAAANDITLLHGAALVELLPRAGRPGKGST